MRVQKPGIVLSSKPLRRRLTRRAAVSAASIFMPQDPNETPESHFPLQTVFTRLPQPRFVNRYDSREILIVVDGSCLNNGHWDPEMYPPAGGCSFIYKGKRAEPCMDGHTGGGLPFLNDGSRADLGIGGRIAFHLEEEGPGGESIGHTSNRAKLRAVIAALEFRPWSAEGWKRVVILTDLEYVVFGATHCLPQWVRRRWRKSKGGRIANRDLWEELHAAIEDLGRSGTEVSFWLVRPGSQVKVNSGLVQDAKTAAREAAGAGVVAAEFHRLCGIEV